MNWFNIIKGRAYARSVKMVLLEAGFPLRYLRGLNLHQWGPGGSSKIFQINPTYLIEAANDFNEWVDNDNMYDKKQLAWSRRHEIGISTSEKAKEHIVKLINQAIHKEEKDKHRKETTFGDE